VAHLQPCSAGLASSRATWPSPPSTRTAATPNPSEQGHDGGRDTAHTPGGVTPPPRLLSRTVSRAAARGRRCAHPDATYRARSGGQRQRSFRGATSTPRVAARRIDAARDGLTRLLGDLLQRHTLLLFVSHARASRSSKVATIGLWSRKPLEVKQLKKELGLLFGLVSGVVPDHVVPV
jgi:hypothetical protein